MFQRNNWMFTYPPYSPNAEATATACVNLPLLDGLQQGQSTERRCGGKEEGKPRPRIFHLEGLKHFFQAGPDSVGLKLAGRVQELSRSLSALLTEIHGYAAYPRLGA